MEPWMFAVLAAVVVVVTFFLRRASGGLSASREAQVRAAWQQDQRRMAETPLYHRVLEPATALNRDHLQAFAASQRAYDRGASEQDAEQVTEGLKGMRAHLAAALTAAREVAAVVGGEGGWRTEDGSTPPGTRYRPPRRPPSGSHGARWELRDETDALDRAVGEVGPAYAAFWNAFLEAEEASQRAAAAGPARECAAALEASLERLAVIEERLLKQG